MGFGDALFGVQVWESGPKRVGEISLNVILEKYNQISQKKVATRYKKQIAQLMPLAFF